jgi:hypothetical protein
MNQTKLCDVIKKPDEKFKGIERMLLVDKLTEIARNGFGTEITHDDVENHVLPVDLLYLMHSSKQVIGFASYNSVQANGKNILYLHGVVIKKPFQGKGLCNEANKEALSEDDYDLFATRTQNPVLYAATEKLVKQLFPGKEQTPEELKEIAEQIAANIGMDNFDKNTFIAKGQYGSCLYDHIPRHRKSEFFDSHLKLDYDAGDCVLLVGRLK